MSSLVVGPSTTKKKNNYNARRPRPKNTLGTWTPNGLQDSCSTVAKTNFRVLSAYNSKFEMHNGIVTGTMVVPGFPPEWSPQPTPTTIPPDSLLKFDDLVPYWSLQPLLRALLTTQPSYDLNQIDIITDRKNLRSLLDFASGKSHQEFWFLVEVINNTALFTTLQPHGRNSIQKGAANIYGHQFEKAFTKVPEAALGTAQYARIVSYGFGGLNVIVRCETDGALSEDMENAARPEKVETAASSLTTLLPSAPNSTQPTALPKWGTTTLTQAGNLVPQDQMIELKTKGGNRAQHVNKCMPQLWFSETQHLYTGYHKKGTFSSITQLVMDGETFSGWETAHKAELGKLVDLLGKIVSTAKEAKRRTCVKSKKGKLVLEEWNEGRGTRSAKKLPEYLRSRWQTQA